MNWQDYLTGVLSGIVATAMGLGIIAVALNRGKEK